MSSEENSDGMEKIMEKGGKTKTITESDIDNWHLELRTNNVCLDEYTVEERMKNLSYLEKSNNERTQYCEEREDACLVTERATERICEEREEACSVRERACEEREKACSVKEKTWEEREEACSNRERACEKKERSFHEKEAKKTKERRIKKQD